MFAGVASWFKTKLCRDRRGLRRTGFQSITIFTTDCSLANQHKIGSQIKAKRASEAILHRLRALVVVLLPRSNHDRLG
jgi:hypothetical protein